MLKIYIRQAKEIGEKAAFEITEFGNPLHVTLVSWYNIMKELFELLKKNAISDSDVTLIVNSYHDAIIGLKRR